jgi:hypothetical protein
MKFIYFVKKSAFTRLNNTYVLRFVTLHVKLAKNTKKEGLPGRRAIKLKIATIIVAVNLQD